MSIKATVHFYTVDGCNSPSSKCQICCLEMRTSLAPAVNEGGCKSNFQLCQKKSTKSYRNTNETKNHAVRQITAE